MNAIQFLIKEHDKVRHVLSDICDESHRYETKLKMFDDLCYDLIRHETMEEEIWYPHFKHKLDATVKHLISEEKSAEKAIKLLKNIKTQEEWESKFLKFKKDVEHHAHEEETKLFPKVENILDEAELEKIGLEMFAFKKEYNH